MEIIYTADSLKGYILRAGENNISIIGIPTIVTDRNIAKKIIPLLIAGLLYCGAAFAADREVPTQTPPCPKEYRGGLKP